MDTVSETTFDVNQQVGCHGSFIEGPDAEARAEDWHESGAELMALDDAVRNTMAGLKAKLPSGWEVAVDPGGWATFNRDAGRGPWRVALLPPESWNRVQDVITATAAELPDAACAALAKYRAKHEPLIDLMRHYSPEHQADALDRLAADVAKAGGVA